MAAKKKQRRRFRSVLVSLRCLRDPWLPRTSGNERSYMRCEPAWMQLGSYTLQSASGMVLASVTQPSIRGGIQVSRGPFSYHLTVEVRREG